MTEAFERFSEGCPYRASVEACRRPANALGMAVWV